MSDSLPVTEADKDQQIADLRALVEQLTAEKAAAAPAVAQPVPAPPYEVPTRVTSDQDNNRAHEFAGALVTDVHEHDRLEARRRLAERGLERWEGPLPEGTVTVDVVAAQGRGA